jgi:hypothetical protein
MEYTICPNCKKKLGSFMSARYIVKDTTTSLINEFRHENAEAYCSDCALPYLSQYRDSIKAEKERLQEIIKSNVRIIPIITANNPLNWNYTVSSILSAQTVTGTGLLSGLSSSWSDFMGGQSGSLQDKLSQGECFVEINCDLRP